MSTVTSVINYEAIPCSTSSSIGNDYRTSSETYEQKTEKKLALLDVLALAGFGCGLKVCKDALVVKQGFTHTTQSPQTTLLYRGVHGIRSILILSDTGNITLEALS